MGPKRDREDGLDWMRDVKTVRLRVEEAESRQVMEIGGMKPRCKRSGGEWDRKPAGNGLTIRIRRRKTKRIPVKGKPRELGSGDCS